MNNFFENLNKVSKSLSLDKDRKGDIRNELIRYMNSNPIVEKKSQASSSHVFVSFVSFFKIRKTVMVPVMICAILVLGAGTSYAAEGSMPGEILYSVKVHVNEEVKAALIFDDDDKVAFEINRAETRLAEADDLAASGKLSAEAKTQVEANLNSNKKRIQQRIKKLEDNGDNQKAADLASHFESSLKAHTSILGAMEDKEKKDNDDVSNFTKNVISTSNDLSNQRKGLNIKISSDKNESNVKASASGKIKAAENTMVEVRKFIELKSTNNQNTSAAKDQLKAAEKLLAEAKTKLELGKYSESFELASKAQSTALRAKALVKIEGRLPDRVRQELPNSINRQEKQERDDEDNDRRGNDNIQTSPSNNPVNKVLPKLNF